jgi:hypothetical protein
MFPSSKVKFFKNVVKTVSSGQNELVTVGNGPTAKKIDTQ